MVELAGIELEAFSGREESSKKTTGSPLPKY